MEGQLPQLLPLVLAWVLLPPVLLLQVQAQVQRQCGQHLLASALVGGA